MIQLQEQVSRINFVVFYNTKLRCWNCFAYLDIEEKIFDNICGYCGSSQRYDREDFEW